MSNLVKTPVKPSQNRCIYIRKCIIQMLVWIGNVFLVVQKIFPTSGIHLQGWKHVSRLYHTRFHIFVPKHTWCGPYFGVSCNLGVHYKQVATKMNTLGCSQSFFILILGLQLLQLFFASYVLKSSSFSSFGVFCIFLSWTPF